MTDPSSFKYVSLQAGDLQVGGAYELTPPVGGAYAASGGSLCHK